MVTRGPIDGTALTFGFKDRESSPSSPQSRRLAGQQSTSRSRAEGRRTAGSFNGPGWRGGASRYGASSSVAAQIAGSVRRMEGQSAAVMCASAVADSGVRPTRIDPSRPHAPAKVTARDSRPQRGLTSTEGSGGPSRSIERPEVVADGFDELRQVLISKGGAQRRDASWKDPAVAHEHGPHCPWTWTWRGGIGWGETSRVPSRLPEPSADRVTVPPPGWLT